MDTLEAIQVVETFTGYQRCFSKEELFSFAETDEEQALLQETILDDYRFIHCIGGENGEEYFIAKQALYHWYVNLNIRLAKAKGNKPRLDCEQLALLMSSLLLDGRWSLPPKQYVGFGQFFSFIRPTLDPNEYFFPLAHILSFMTQSKTKIALEIFDTFNHIPWLELPTEQFVLELIEDGLEKLPPMDRNIIIRREGLLGNRKMTLEQIGQINNLTRQRISQLESKASKKIYHPTYNYKFIAPLLLIIICNEGSLLITNETMTNEIKFVARCNNIPFWTFPHTNVLILGVTKADTSIMNNIWRFVLDKNEVARQLETNTKILVDKRDMLILAERLVNSIKRNITKYQKVYLALKYISRPAHFTEVTNAYNNIFPEDQLTEHNIHAKLVYNPHGIVWIGVKGTYALEEWGYKRPSLTLFNTIVEIVEQAYEETSNPVPYSLILAELGRYRQVVNPSSVILATSLNPRLMQTTDNCFIPKPIEESEIGSSAEELDRILREFESQFGAHPNEEDTW